MESTMKPFIVLLALLALAPMALAVTDTSDASFESSVGYDFQQPATSIRFIDQTKDYVLVNVTQHGGTTATRVFVSECNNTAVGNRTFISTNPTTNTERIRLKGTSVYLISYGTPNGTAWTSQRDTAYVYPQSKTNIVYEDSDCNTTTVTGTTLHNIVSIGTEEFRPVTFVNPTPNNNSFVQPFSPFTVNVSVSGLNFTRAFLNFSGTVHEFNLTRADKQNVTSFTLDGTTMAASRLFAFTTNASTVNVSIISTGGGTWNAFLNGVLLGSNTGAGTFRFDGRQASFNHAGMNNVSFSRIAGTSTVTLIDVNTTRRDYEFGTSFSLAYGNYSYFANAVEGGVTYSAGVRFLRSLFNASPAWTFPVAFPTSPSTYSPTESRSFNVTWTDAENDTDTVRIFHDFNGSFLPYATSQSGTRYSYVTGPLSAGNYSWKHRANDTQGNVNETDLFAYQVLPAASSVRLWLDETEGDVEHELGDQVDVRASVVAGAGVLELLVNGSVVAQGFPNVTFNTTFTVNGTYHVIARLNDTLNYSSSSVMRMVIVPPFTYEESGIFRLFVCPMGSLIEVVIFVAVGAFLLALLFINLVTLRVPAINFLIGLSIVFYGMVLIGCAWWLGMIVGAVGMLVMFALLLVP